MPNFLLIREINNSKIKQKSKVRDMKNFLREDFQNTLKIKISWTFLILKTLVICTMFFRLNY